MQRRREAFKVHGRGGENNTRTRKHGRTRIDGTNGKGETNRGRKKRIEEEEELRRKEEEEEKLEREREVNREEVGREGEIFLEKRTERVYEQRTVGDCKQHGGRETDFGQRKRKTGARNSQGGE